ncbi:MAG: T9SS type A sorting domain-containing protein [Bacteroidetes bacterium]|nr:T9SS type A sorting domain-containing protein [Bacteroidota bacterium]
MKTVVTLLVLLSLGFCSRYIETKAPFYYTELSGPNEIQTDSTIDITYYKLILKIQLSPNYIYGVTTVNGKMPVPGNSFFLNFSSSMTVDSVTGNNVASFSHNYDLLQINLASVSSTFSVNVYYKGLPGSTGYGSFVFGSHNSQPAVWSLSEPYGSSDWFPNKNTPGDKADSSDVWITCPSGLTAVSNGLLNETVSNPDNTVTYKWHGSYPISSYLISLAVSNYTLYKNYFRYSQNDSLALTHYIYPEYFDQVKSNLDETPKMLSVFSEKYTLYPFIREKYGHAQFGWGGGMEHQTISSMGAFSSGVISHELSHQWFGDKVTCRDFRHIWLNEGFATFSEAVYIEATQGKDAYDYFMKSRMNYSKFAVGSVYVQNPNSVSEIFDTYRSYYKGSFILHMLRGITGDSLFFSILKTYVNDTARAYNTAATEDFQAAAERIYGKSLAYFFYEWVYGENYPKYSVVWDKARREDNTYDVIITLTQAANTTPSFFTMPVDFKILTKNSDTTVTFFNNAASQTFTLNLPGEPVSLTFDPSNKILKDKAGDDPVEPVTFDLGQNYPNPFNVSLKVYDVTGRKVASLVNTKQRPGNYEVVFSPYGLASGVYYYILVSGGITMTKKLVYIR